MIDGKAVGLDSFGKPESFSKAFKKLVESYALDAIDWFDPEKEHKALKNEVTRFMKSSLTANVESRESIGLGRDLRIESRKITGFALSLDDQILHLSIFARENGRAQGKYTSRMERDTQRRQNRIY